MGLPQIRQGAQQCGKESTWHLLGIASSSIHGGKRVHQGLTHFSEVNSAASEGGSGGQTLSEGSMAFFVLWPPLAAW